MDAVGMPRLMAVLNASPESFSGAVVDAGSVADRVRTALAGGATLLDVGGQSLRTDQAEIPVDQEIGRTVPVVVAVRSALDGAAGGPDMEISVDTYRAPVADAALAAGATIVNDPSGLSDPGMAAVLLEWDATVVVTYNRARPKVRLGADRLTPDPVGDGLEFLAERLADLEAAGVSAGRVLVDPGPDLGKSPAQTVEVLSHLDRFRGLGLPLLLALSRKDFIGALTSTGPLDRAPGLFGTLAALELGPRDVLRVHEPGPVRDFFLVRAAVRGDLEVDPLMELAPHLRHIRPVAE